MSDLHILLLDDSDGVFIFAYMYGVGERGEETE
jgi:hypothetical protein